MHVLTREELVEACQQPVAVGTAVTAIGMIPINIVAMFTLFTKTDQLFKPAHLMANQHLRKY